MIIIADEKELLSKFLSEKKSPSTNYFGNNKTKSLIKSIFPKKEVFSTINSRLNFLEYFLITKYAKSSQFDIINQFVSQNIELPKNFACIAEEGDGFHGFRNRTWRAEKGNIHLSLYFEPKNTSKYFHAGLLILSAVAILKTIDSIPELKGLAKTKWVNDIVIGNSKVCGIITQSFSTGSKISGAVIGIGLNVNTEPSFTKDRFTTSAESLSNLSGIGSLDLPKILNILLINLGNSIQLLENEKYADLLKIYTDRSDVIGREVEIYSDPIKAENQLLHEGKVIEINENLELVFDNKTIKSGRLAYKKLGGK